MASDDLATLIRRQLEARADRALMAYGEAWAEEARRIVSVRTGALKISIRVARTGNGMIELRMLGYGRHLSEGHRVWNWGTSTRPNRVYKTRGFVPGTYFIGIAHRSAKVRAARRAMQNILAGKE